MTRLCSLILASLLATAWAAWSQEKPIAALGRVAVLGDISEGEKRIIANRIETFLSRSYDLISEEKFLAAEEEAFQTLEFDECTEDICVRLIQEILQVERLFILQIIREAELTQLSLVLYRSDSRRIEEDVCRECSITQLHAQAENLARLLIDEDLRHLAAEGGVGPAAESDRRALQQRRGLAEDGGAGEIDDAHALPVYLRDRGRGVSTTLSGTYVRDGELLIIPIYEFGLNNDDIYTPSELGFTGEEEFVGKSEEQNYVLVIAYGLSDSFAIELETVLYTSTKLKTDPDDQSGTPDEIVEDGLGDVATKFTWRWIEETAEGPELYGFFEIEYPLHKDNVLIGNRDWVFVPGIGMIKGYAWGTLKGRFSFEYSLEDDQLEAGEYGIEYLKRHSAVWRTAAILEGAGDAISGIFEAQWFIKSDVFAKFNIALGLTKPADDYGYETGVVMSF